MNPRNRLWPARANATTAALAAVLATVLALANPGASAADKHDGAPRHGGVVTAAAHLEIELVVSADAVRLYLRDHGKPVMPDGASAKLTLLTGGAKVEATLIAAGGALEAKGAFQAAGTKAVVVLTRPGKSPVVARFTLK